MTLPVWFRRYFRYSLLGCATFALDFSLLFVLTEIFDFYYLASAAFSFITATSINYLISRDRVFPGSARGRKTGYVFFLLIGVGGLLIVLGGLYVLVEILGLYYLVGRLLIAAASGTWNYLMNLHVNFKVAGMKYE